MHRFRMGSRYARFVVIAPIVALGILLFSQAQSPAIVYSSLSLSSLRGNPLVVPAGDTLFAGQLSAADAARRSSPQAVFARERSRTAYAHLDATSAARLLKASFPSVFAHASGAPALPSGAQITGYPTAHALDVSLPGHVKAVVESSAPLAVRSAHGHFASIDLGIKRAVGGYVPAGSDVTVRIPDRLSAGVAMPGDGVTLTPVDGYGHALAGSGSAEGSAVVYASTQLATDTVVKPTAVGFEIDAVLRSIDSPEVLYYKVGAPGGSKLVQNRLTGAIEVLRLGSRVAVVLPPGSVDAAGVQVPTTMRLVGDTVVVGVAHREGSYLYPIDVDPEINDSQLAVTGGGKHSNWKFQSSNEAKFGHKEGPGEFLETSGIAEYKATEVAYWFYKTSGNSKIYEVKTKTAAKNKLAKIESFLEFESPTGGESKKMLSTEFEEPEYGEKVSTICAWNASKVEECLPAAGKEKNVLRFQQSATASPGSNYKFSDSMSEAVVSISEPSGEHSTTSFNTTSPELEGEVEEEGKKFTQKRVNALYGSGAWLTKFKGALQFIAKDPGIGVATTRLEYEKPGVGWETLSEHKYLENNGCQGVQCYAEHTEFWTLDPKLPDGEDKIRYRAEEAISGTVSLSSETESSKTVKVDTKAPRSLHLLGLPAGNELSERPYKLTGTATDGTGSTVVSSGVKSIKLFVEGHEISEIGTQVGCTATIGECSAKAEWSINGAELGAGHHAVVVVATDNAGNEERLPLTVSVHHSTPINLGPGSVDLQSGDYAIGAKDVSMGTGLTVERNYSSRAVEQGLEGGLGQQWNLSLGTSESLSELIDGSVLLTSANGEQTIFASLGGGKFEPPTGDANLTLELEENKTTKQKLAYYLKDTAAGSKVKFTQPSGSGEWVPTKQEGTVAADTLTYSYRTVEHHLEYPLPSSNVAFTDMTTGPDGNIWYTENRFEHCCIVGEMTPSGKVITEHTLGFTLQSITTGSDNNIWMAAGNDTILKMTPNSESAQSFFVPHGSSPEDITPGPEGSLWFTEPGTNKIGRITTAGEIKEFALPASSWPVGIAAGPDGNLWYTERGTNKIGRMSTSGTIIGEYAVPAGSTPLRIAQGPEKDKKMWFTDAGTSKVGSITTSGTITVQEYALPAASEPVDITKGPDEHMWFVERKAVKVGKISTSGSVTEFSSFPTNSYLKAITTGPEGNIWYANEFTVSPFKGALGMMTPSGTMTEPTVVEAPAPEGVTCAPMKAGCRSLKFSYNSTNQLLKTVSLETYEPIAKKMQETAIAEYSYNEKGWLTAEWDPRISPALKTSYGYDEEGHLTALTEPGQETWSFIYGTIPGDTGTGRLLKVARPSATTGLWNGEAVKNTEAPKITGTPLVGVRLAVSDGTWTNTPVAYAYQWEDCQTYPEWVCTVIPGANGANYKPVPSDVGFTLRAVVKATNGGGTVAAMSARTVAIEPREFTEYSLPSGSLPYGIAKGPDGRMWFTEEGNGKVGAVSPTTEALTEYETGKNAAPEGITGGPDGNVWWVEHSIRNVDHITPTGGVTVYTLTRTNTYNVGIVKGPDGNLWFTESSAKYVGVINSKDEVLKEYALPASSKPYGITVGPDGNLWVADNGLSKIDKITTAGAITEYALPAGSNPYWITTGSDGNLWFTDNGTNKVGKITTAGVITEYALPAGSQPRGITARPGWTYLYVAEYGTNKIAVVNTTGTIAEEVSLPAGSQPNLITEGPDNKNLWFTEYGRNKIVRFNPSHTEGSVTEGSVRAPIYGTALEYGTPLSGSGLPTMTEAEVSKWGQQDVPVEGTAVIPSDADQGWPASSYARATIYYLDAEGNTVNVSSPSEAMYGSVSTTEYNELHDVTRTLSSSNRQTALEAGGKSADEAKLLSTYFTYREECSKESENKHEAEGAEGARLCETEGPVHEVKYRSGSEQKESLARLHTKYFYDENSLNGETYNLLTKKQTVAELFNSEGSTTGEEVEARTTVDSYSEQSNLGWKLRAPTSVTEDPEGKDLVHMTFYNSTTGQVTETRAPNGSGGNSAHDTKFIYYTSAANTEGYPSCGGHPEWGGLLCETLPSKQPGVGSAPQLPVSVTSSYNMWSEPLVTTETFGTTVRTKTNTYDAAGRLATSETSSTANVALPKVTNEYNSTMGLLEKESTTVEAKTKTVTAKYNKLGQITEYTDADGNLAKYKYAGPENDLLLEEVSDGSNGGTGHQTYSYNVTTKLLEKLQDSAAGTFTASYDAEGRLVKEVYPNAMCANTKYDSAGNAVSIQYIKTSNCAEVEPKVWFSETSAPAVRGETFSRSSTLANETYTYDSVGRLTETQETPTGEGCTVRLYGYDKESNRTSQTTRTPGTGGKCATEGGTVLEHTYDEGNRLIDSGVSYDAFGNVTKLPAADAEGHELTSTFYVDGAVATQAQNGVTNNYFLDPTGRTRETVSGSNTIISHYDADGEAVAWTSESGGKSTRNIPGIGGALVATQTNGETPVLQLDDLEGNIVATASLSTEATSLLSTYNSTEFGVPNAGKSPPKFAWLGAGGVASALSSGVVTYGATSYVPQIGRALQSEQVEPPGAPQGTGMGAAYTEQVEPWIMQGAAREGAEAPGLEAAREQAAAEAAIEAALAAGGGIDPHRWFTQKEAVEVGETLNAVKDWGEVWGAVFTVLGLVDPIGAVIGATVAMISSDVMEHWLHNTGGKLEQCGKNRESWVVGCELSFKDLPGGVINFYSTSEVEKCGTYTWYAKKAPYLKEAWECRRLKEAPGPV